MYVCRNFLCMFVRRKGNNTFPVVLQQTRPLLLYHMHSVTHSLTHSLTHSFSSYPSGRLRRLRCVLLSSGSLAARVPPLGNAKLCSLFSAVLLNMSLASLPSAVWGPRQCRSSLLLPSLPKRYPIHFHLLCRMALDTGCVQVSL